MVNLLRDELLDAPLVFGDETELQVLKEPGRSAQAQSYIWAQMTDGCGKDGTALALCAGIREGTVLIPDGYEV
ncbi:Transposase IS66 family protein (plasmid) [Variovorax sp. RA8]|nr:Transposase IS66 family protein [Variovorax sp. RA8]